MLKLTTNKSPDILDCIANLSNDEVFTSPKIANQILDALPPEVWENPDLTFLDPCCKTGIFLREIAKRLLHGLRNAIPDENIRRKHIFENMIYGIAITELTGLISRRTLYYTKDATSKESVAILPFKDGNIVYKNTSHIFHQGHCSICGASKAAYARDHTKESHAYTFIHRNINRLFQRQFKKKGLPVKFDVIVGNPPYQLKDEGHGASASPLYHLFVQKAIEHNPKYLSFIIPSRWFAGGKGLDSFRGSMLKDKRIKKLVDFPDASDCFPGVEIKGGVSYFLWDKDYHGNCEVTTISKGLSATPMIRDLNEFDIFIRLNQAVTILNKVKNLNETTMDTVVSSQKPFGFRTNYSDFEKEKFEKSIKLYARGETGWVATSKIVQNKDWIEKWKVLTAAAAEGDGTFPNKITGAPKIAEPNSVCTETYLVVGVYDSKENAEKITQYLKTKFVRFLISLRKNAQHLSKERFSFVPMQDLNNDISKFTDAELFKKYNLSNEEIAFISTIVKEMP